MSLSLNIRTPWNSAGTSLFIYDTTGTAPAGGWGAAGNPTVASAQTAQLTIVRPDITTVGPINVYPTLPNTDNIPYEATNLALGYGTGSITDGVYIFNYTVTGTFGGSSYTATYNRQIFLYPQACCCVERMAAKVRACGKNCKDELKEAFSDAWDTLTLLENAVSCGNMTEANEFLLQLQTICASQGCNCGH